MIHSVQQIRYDLLAYIKEFGGGFGDWYVGIAERPMDALTGRHNVDLDCDIWLYRQALSLPACQTVQRYFVNLLKTDGNAAEAMPRSADCIYLFRKSPTTVPAAALAGQAGGAMAG